MFQSLIVAASAIIKNVKVVGTLEIGKMAWLLDGLQVTLELYFSIYWLNLPMGLAFSLSVTYLPVYRSYLFIHPS